MDRSTLLLLAAFILGAWVVTRFWFLLISNHHQEGLEGGPVLSNALTKSVDLPITGQWSCKNFCAPTARCALTGQQCLADADCPGCQEPIPPANDPMLLDPLKNAGKAAANVGAGKLTSGPVPTFSPLTHGFGTHERRVAPQPGPPPAQANFGINVWTQPMLESKRLFDQRYGLPNGSLQFQPDYGHRPSLTGMFVEDGPLPANV